MRQKFCHSRHDLFNCELVHSREFASSGSQPFHTELLSQGVGEIRRGETDFCHDRNPSHGGAVFRLSERINPLQISTADGTQSDPLRRCLRLNETESCHSETTGTFAVWRLGWSVPVPLRTWHAWGSRPGSRSGPFSLALFQFPPYTRVRIPLVTRGRAVF